MTNVAAERDAFEAWYAKRHPKPTHENSTWAHCAKMDDWEVWQARAGAAPAAVAPQGEYPPLPEATAYGNRDELDNMLDDRSATVHGKADGWRGTPLFDAAALRAYFDPGRQAALALEAPVAAACPGPITDIDVARVYRQVYGGPRFGSTEREFAEEIARLRDKQWETALAAFSAMLAAAPQAPAAPSYPPAFGPNDWVMSVAGTVVKLSEWEPGAVKARTIYGEAAPAAPSADERTAYVEFLAGKFPQTYSKEDAEHWWDHGHVSALTWQAARAVAAAPAAPAVDASDTALLDAIERERIAVIPEFEGPWDAQIFGEDEATLACGSGATPRKAITEALASLEARKAHDAAQAKEGGDQ